MEVYPPPAEPFWTPEDFDKHIPEGGFLADLVLAGRGAKPTTKLTLWTGLFLISAVAKRRVYMEWGFERLFPNMFIMLIAPPSLCGKSTIINRAARILKALPKYLEGREKATHQVNTITGKFTPEALLRELAKFSNQTQDYYIGNRLHTDVKKGAQAAVIADELSFLLGRQSYNTGAAANFLKLYDCQTTGGSTLSGGPYTIKDPYVAVVCGTTWSGFESSVTTEALQDGFISRFTLVHEPVPKRKHALPSVPDNVPSDASLTKRLAHIAHLHEGEFRFSPEALAAYETWYDTTWQTLVERLSDNNTAHFRLDTTVVKVAFLLRLQRYEPGNEITNQDFWDAVNLVTATIDGTEDLVVNNLGRDPWSKKFIRVENSIRQRGEVTRTALQRNVSGADVRWNELNEILRNLAERKCIAIIQKGQPVNPQVPSSKGSEVYKWIEGVRGPHDLK